MDELQHQKVFSKNDNVVFREESEYSLLFNIETGRIHKINSTAVTIWKSIDSTRTVSEIMEQVRKEYGNIETIPADVVEFLSSLKEGGYIMEVL
jgi:hypothetical protein